MSDEEATPEGPDLAPVLERSRELGFLGPGPIDAHIVHADTFAEALHRTGAVGEHEAPARCLDMGTGGGVPGLLLARRWPGSRWTLLDSMLRRTTILRDEVEALGWSERVDVVCERAEAAARDPDLRGQFDLVTSRSFGAPAVTAECARGFLRDGGHLVVSDPPTGPGDRWPAAPLGLLGYTVVGHGAGCTVVRAVGDAPHDVPRDVGKPGKAPLY